LQTQLASASTSAEVTALTAQLTDAQAALAAAIAANATAATDNATAIASNATNIEKLLAELATLATSLDAIKTDLANAATAEAVTKLQADLLLAQADLATILAQNNVYTPDANTGLVINSAASLDVADSLGSQLTIINGGVNITNGTSNALDATKLQAVLDRIVTVTGTMTYTQSGTGSAPNFDALTSAGNITIDNEHGISFANLSNVGVLNVTADDKVTSFSAPKLSTIGSFASHTLNLRKATSIDLSSLAAYGTTGATTLTINGNNVSAGFDLKMPLFQDHGTDGIIRGITLNIGGYVNNLTLPLMKYKTSTITANDAKVIVLDAFNGTLTSGASSNHVDVTLGAAMKNYTGGPKLEKVNITGILTGASVTGNPAEGPNFIFDSAAKLVSATIAGEAGDVSFDGNTNVETVVVSADAVQVGLTGATSLVSATISGDVRGNIDATGSTSLETIAVSGAANTITLSGNTSLTGVTLTGSAQVVSIDGASALTSLDLGHTSAFPANATTGVAQTAATSAASLHIFDNDELTSIKADKVKTVASLKIYDNPVLTSVSFDAITAPAAGYTGTSRIWVGATTSGATVTASKNKLEAQTIVEGEDVTLSTGAVRTTATITSNSGLSDLAAMIAAAKADTKNDVAVYFDNVDTYTTKAGVTTNDETGLTAKTRIADFASNTASTASKRFKNSIAKSLTGVSDSDSGSNSTLTLSGNGSQIVLTKLSTETADEFIARVNGASGLTSVSVTAGDIDEVGRIEIGTLTTSAYTATILFGSSSYASATSTPTVGTNAKVVLALTASSTVSSKAEAATEFARQINAATSLKMQSFNSSTYSNTGNYTTTTTNFHDLYVVAASGNYVTIQKKKTVLTTAAGTATTTVADRTASAPQFRMFNNGSAVFGTIWSKTNDYYVMLADDLFGANNTPALTITAGSDFTGTSIVEEYSAYSATTGAWTTRASNVPYHGLDVRANEVDIDGADSNARTAATNAYYVTTYYTWN